MNARDMWKRLDGLIDVFRVGIFTTVDESGFPRSRWMTPILLPGREGCLYAVTSPSFRKAIEVARNPRVEWAFQTRALDEILTLNGRVELIDNPSLKSEVQEALGTNLTVFWRVNPNESSLVVVETRVEEFNLFLPMKNERHRVVV
jgi:general stress protein 26